MHSWGVICHTAAVKSRAMLHHVLIQILKTFLLGTQFLTPNFDFKG